MNQIGALEESTLKCNRQTLGIKLQSKWTNWMNHFLYQVYTQNKRISSIYQIRINNTRINPIPHLTYTTQSTISNTYTQHKTILSIYTTQNNLLHWAHIYNTRINLLSKAHLHNTIPISIHTQESIPYITGIHKNQSSKSISHTRHNPNIKYIHNTRINLLSKANLHNTIPCNKYIHKNRSLIS